MDDPLRLTGIGLRSPHFSEFLTQQPNIAWLEVHSENYFADGGNFIQTLEKIRANYPISLHGVSMSLGSCDGLNWQHLKKLKELCKRIDPCLISEHLSWSSIDGVYFHDLLPLPYTEEAINLMVENIIQVQDYLNRQLLIENISSYITYKHSNLSEAEFLVEIATRSGCGILLDINNIYVNATNLKFDASKYLQSIPTKYIHEYHLGGYSKQQLHESEPESEILIDTHNQAVSLEVWELYTEAIKLLGRKPTIIEWDKDVPPFATLQQEAIKAETIMREAHVTTKPAN